MVVGTIAILGLAGWAIVEASTESSHDQDSSHHTTVYVDGDGNTVTVHPDSWSSSSSRSGY